MSAATIHESHTPEIPAHPPKVIGRFKIYSGIQCLLYLAFSISCFSVDPTVIDAEEGGMHIASALQLVVALGFFGAWVLPLVVRPRPWLWTYDLVLISIGPRNICMLPASIPLLRDWHKPETKSYFGKA